MPSGLNADTGEPQGAAVHAAVTLTVGAPKTGMLLRNGLAVRGTAGSRAVTWGWFPARTQARGAVDVAGGFCRLPARAPKSRTQGSATGTWRLSRVVSAFMVRRCWRPGRRNLRSPG